MREKNAINELNLLLQIKKDLNSIGRDIDYIENNRINELRKFLDSLNEEKIEIEPIELDF